MAPAMLQAQYLYRTQLYRAAPGKLEQLIATFKSRMDVFEKGGIQKPVLIRHSQGDHWDLLLLQPVESYAVYYSSENIQKREQAAAPSGMTVEEFEERLNQLVSWNEDLFVQGPPLEQFNKALANTGYYHVEMFIALAGKHDELYRQREMENIYLEHLGRPQNLIFHRGQGAAWDLFTLGAYSDLKHFAASADIPAFKEDEAARKAGFESAGKIGFYLRSLILRHNDTLAGRVN